MLTHRYDSAIIVSALVAQRSAFDTGSFTILSPFKPSQFLFESPFSNSETILGFDSGCCPNV